MSRPAGLQRERPVIARQRRRRALQRQQNGTAIGVRFGVIRIDRDRLLVTPKRFVVALQAASATPRLKYASAVPRSDAIARS